LPDSSEALPLSQEFFRSDAMGREEIFEHRPVY